MISFFNRLGYASVFDYLLKVGLPVFAICGIMFFTVRALSIGLYFDIIVMAIGFLFVLLYPIIINEKRRVSIDQNLHFFITYGGALSTVGLSRPMFFKMLGEKKHYGYTSELMKKMVYVAKRWNVGFAKTTRKLAKLCPSTILSGFLYRLASSLDFGVDLENFLWEEQDSLMQDYSTQYKQSIENISMLREVYIAMTISFAFAMSAALLLPMIMGIPMSVALQFGIVGIITIDLIMLVLIQAFIPPDRLLHKLKHKDELSKIAFPLFCLALAVCSVIFYLLFMLTSLDLLVVFAVSCIPLFFIGLLGKKIEKQVSERDRDFPAFVRSLGSTLYAQGTSVTTSLKSLIVHELGSIKILVENLYKRLFLRINNEKAWYFFSAESGSNLINQFVNIFYEAIYLGGHPVKIGEIVSKNFQQQLSLRKLRLQMASSLRGALYGALLGFVGTIYISYAISGSLSEMFSSAQTDVALEGQFSGLAASLFPVPDEQVAGTSVTVMLAFIIIIHSFFSAFMLKMIDGGSKYSLFVDFVLMLLLGATIVFLMPIFVGQLISPVEV
ncbi:MAG TPA: hypothetical protein ENN46_00180 [Candidatus Woesearchaeota archaeon]|nr:hypothetical protein [Candidatus Woesearchaeota archaeon]